MTKVAQLLRVTTPETIPTCRSQYLSEGYSGYVADAEDVWIAGEERWVAFEQLGADDCRLEAP